MYGSPLISFKSYKSIYFLNKDATLEGERHAQFHVMPWAFLVGFAKISIAFVMMDILLKVLQF